MLIDAHTLKTGSSLTADVCIAGAGAAGITLARALAHSGLRILLLESGGFEPDLKTQALYQGSVIGQEYWALHTSRLRYFGGSTNHWTGWCRPLDAVDFTARPGMLGGWPLDYDEMRPFYAMAQRDCELDSFDYRASTWAQRYQTQLIPLDDHAWDTVTWQFSPPTRFGQKYRQQLVASEAIQILTQANVTNVGLGKTGGNVERFDIRCLNGSTLTARAAAYVLALGGLENPRLLLASSDVARYGVGNDRDVVGRYFSDHPHSVVGQIMLGEQHESRGYLGPFQRGQGTPVRFSWALSEAARETAKMPGMSVTMDRLETNRSREAEEDMESEGVGSLMEHLGSRPTSHKHALFLRAEQPPTLNSRVKLGGQRDALGMRRIELDWRLQPELDEEVRQAVRSLALSLGRHSIGRVLSFPHKQSSLPQAPMKAGQGWPKLWGGHHHIGTTRMSEDPRYGVVNRNCKVHDIDNLFCAGSSVFATAGYANPTLTICALARRLAQHLTEHYA